MLMLPQSFKIKNKKKILIVNRCATDNYGDRVIGHTMLQLFSNEKTKCHLADYTFQSRNCPNGRALNHLMTVIEMVKDIVLIINADSIIIGGGELISNNNKFYKCLKLWDRLINIFHPKIYRCIFSCGATDSFGDDRNIRKILEKFNYIYVRDPYSKELLNRICPEYTNIDVVPDCVFAYNVPIANRDNSSIAALGITDARRFNNHGKVMLDEDKLVQYYEGLVNKYSEMYDKILLIYNTKTDKVAAKFVYDKLHDKYSMLELATIKDEFDFVRILGKAAVVASPRMHSSIVAMIQKVPCDPIIISNKMEVFYDLYFPFDHNSVLALKDKIGNASKSVLHSIIGES